MLNPYKTLQEQQDCGTGWRTLGGSARFTIWSGWEMQGEAMELFMPAKREHPAFPLGKGHKGPPRFWRPPPPSLPFLPSPAALAQHKHFLATFLVVSGEALISFVCSSVHPCLHPSMPPCMHPSIQHSVSISFAHTLVQLLGSEEEAAIERGDIYPNK